MCEIQSDPVSVQGSGRAFVGEFDVFSFMEAGKEKKGSGIAFVWFQFLNLLSKQKLNTPVSTQRHQIACLSL